MDSYEHRLALRHARADALEAKAERLERQAGASPLTGDMAFWTQPGNTARKKAQAKAFSDLEKTVQAEELRKKAEDLRKPLPKKGDAARRQEEKAATISAKKGDWFLSIYGWNKVSRVNKKSLSFEGCFESIAVPLHLVQKVLPSKPI